MQFGFLEFADIIQVSAQPVTPSSGITEATGAAFLPASAYCWFTGQAVPITMSPDLKPWISSVYTAQYLSIIVDCCFRRSTAASSCSVVSSRSEEHTSEP